MKISLKQLEESKAIILPNIQTGLEDFPHIILKKSESEYLELLKSMIERNSPEQSYADFYWGRLKEEEKSLLIRSFPDQKKQLWSDLIASFHISADDLYFTLDHPLLLEMLHFLTSREILFSSFYFTKYPCTVWGNYHLSYPVIFKDEASKCAYVDLITPNRI